MLAIAHVFTFTPFSHVLLFFVCFFFNLCMPLRPLYKALKIHSSINQSKQTQQSPSPIERSLYPQAHIT